LCGISFKISLQFFLVINKFCLARTKLFRDRFFRNENWILNYQTIKADEDLSSEAPS